MSFDDTSREPEQAFCLNRDPLAELEYPTKYVSECIYTQFVKIIHKLSLLLSSEKVNFE